MGVSWFIHVVFLPVRFFPVVPFVWPLPDSLLVQRIKDFLRGSVASVGGIGGDTRRKVLEDDTTQLCVLLYGLAN